MQVLRQLDTLVESVVTELYQCVPFPDWKTVTMFSKYTPDASVSGHDFDFTRQNGEPGLYVLPDDEALTKLEHLTKQHWRLTQDLGQPRWSKLTVALDRSGKYSVDFEYKDDYEEGDIMKRG